MGVFLLTLFAITAVGCVALPAAFVAPSVSPAGGFAVLTSLTGSIMCAADKRGLFATTVVVGLFCAVVSVPFASGEFILPS